MNATSLSCAVGALFLSCALCVALDGRITVDVKKPICEVSKTLWGIFFEEINHAGDGGIYAEMVRNRSFEDADKPIFWELIIEGDADGEMAIDESLPLNENNKRSLRIDVRKNAGGRVAVANHGYWGMNIIKGKTYALSLYARCSKGFKGALLITLEHPSGLVYAMAKIDGLSERWRKFETKLTPNASDTAGRLVISVDGVGTVWLDMVSMMPEERWKGLSLRPDLMRMLEGLKPSFVRFPGGCFVEGDTLKDALRWRNTLGDVAERKTRWCIWGYYSTEGLGLHEYLMMCEALGAEPVLVVNCGMSHKEVAPIEKMDEWIEDALSAIEYAIGPVTSKWGAMRARNGHPEPFKLRFVEIGNENSGRAYEERYAMFYKAIKERYPHMQIIANVPVRSAPVEIVDEHFYNSPEWFIANSTRYDSYDRNGPKIFVGEYAVTRQCGTGNLRAAIAEAAFMTGIERNSDIVIMAAYAPLFVNINHRSWNPNLICFDNCNVYGTPSYYVQMLFSQNRGDIALPVIVEAQQQLLPLPHGAIGLGTWRTQAEFKELKVMRGDEVIFDADFAKAGLKGWRVFRGDWRVEGDTVRQLATGEDMRIVGGDAKWSDYTIKLKARKIAGEEGFLIMFRVRDDNNWYWWNIGGWGNRWHAIERCLGGSKTIVGDRVQGGVEVGKWYDIQVEVKGNRIRCYLDGKLIHDVEERGLMPLHASATMVKATNEVIVKVVNTSDSRLRVSIALNGVKRLKRTAKLITLTGNSPDEENSFSQPRRIAPVERELTNVANPLYCTLAPYSLTVMRLQVDE